MKKLIKPHAEHCEAICLAIREVWNNASESFTAKVLFKENGITLFRIHGDYRYFTEAEALAEAEQIAKQNGF